MSLVDHARAELKRAGMFDEDADYNGKLGGAVVELVEKFAEQGHSGGSAMLTVALFEKLARYKLLSPLENPMKNGEYHDVSEYCGPDSHVLQSTKLGSLFSNNGGKDWHDLDKPLSWFQRKVLRQRRAFVTFPYMPDSD